jgi:hypothetical protein
LWTKGLNVKGIHEEICPDYVWKSLSQEAVHISEELSKIADDVEPGAEVAESTVKNFVLHISTQW